MHNSQSKFDVFISYSHQDGPLVHKVADELEKNGIRVWIDREGVCYTHAIKRRLVEGILSSRCVLYFSSNNSNRSDWSYKEISFASRKKKPILPIRIDNSPYHEVVEFDINDIAYLDYTDPSKREEKFNELLDYLQKGTPLHPKESKRSFVDNLKKAWKTLKEYSGKRSRFVNLLLIALQVLGMIALVLLGGVSIDRSITRFVSAPLDSIADIYGKGFIPGLLLSLIIVICNGLIL